MAKKMKYHGDLIIRIPLYAPVGAAESGELEHDEDFLEQAAKQVLNYAKSLEYGIYSLPPKKDKNQPYYTYWD